MGDACGPQDGISPNSGPVGSQVAISLTNNIQWLAGPYTVYWSKTATVDYESAIKVLVADAGMGQVSQINAVFVVPETPYGSNYVQLVRQFRAADPYGFTFTVTPQIAVNPHPPPREGKVTIMGYRVPESGYRHRPLRRKGYRHLF